MRTDQTEQYKYLGEPFNSNNNMSNHIQEIERKTEAALQTNLFIAGDDNFKGIQLDTIWTILETCIVPIITHGSETWDLNKTEKKKLNKILDNLIKRILAIPQTTPRGCIYEELQIMDIEHRIIERCLNYYKGMTSRKNTSLREILDNSHPKTWNQQTIQTLKDLNINEELFQKATRKQTNATITTKTKKRMDETLEREGKNKSKLQYLRDNQNRNRKTKTTYLRTLNRQEVGAIFMARTRMIQCKRNYKTNTKT